MTRPPSCDTARNMTCHFAARGSGQRTALVLGLSLVLGCAPTDPMSPGEAPEAAPAADLSLALTSYFPPAEASGGWRKTTGATKIRSLGMDPAKIADLGSYAMSLPWEGYATGVSGYDPRNKAAIVIKNGWIVGEYYNRSAARTAVYYLASNGKTFTMMLVGRLQLEYVSLDISLSTRLYDKRWLSQGFPLTDSRKADITVDHVFRHTSGIIPEVEAKVAGGAVVGGNNWDFEPFNLGKDADYPVTAPLYFDPGNPGTYTKGSTYSSVAFNHFSFMFRNVTGLEPSLYLRSGILDRIGVGRMDYKLPPGMGTYRWATGGNGLASARDYARLAYLLLHEGTWSGNQIFTAAWIRQFTTRPNYPNIRSNANCEWGSQYPKDVYRIVGSGVNLALVVPSLDLLVTLNGRTPSSLRDEVTGILLQKLFAAVTQQYQTCNGQTINGAPVAVTQAVTALTLMNADTDQPILTLSDGMTLTLANLPSRRLNVRAETSPSPVGSIRFGLDATANYRTETNAPYSLAGDDNGDYFAWTPAAGSHTLKATPYSAASATGAAGTALTVGFTVE
jgi:CubicO group peptidase (beta-lactamase class C family)